MKLQCDTFTHRCHFLVWTLVANQIIRLGSIEEAQRKLYRGAKRQEFLRFARRKWLASDRAAETVQKTFRAYIGRKRAGLAAEVRRLTGKARMDWVEVSFSIALQICYLEVDYWNACKATYRRISSQTVCSLFVAKPIIDCDIHYAFETHL